MSETTGGKKHVSRGREIAQWAIGLGIIGVLAAIAIPNLMHG